jgi:hypothetical protein
MRATLFRIGAGAIRVERGLLKTLQRVFYGCGCPRWGGAAHAPPHSGGFSTTRSECLTVIYREHLLFNK